MLSIAARPRSHAEPFEHKERRGFALSVMDNPDQLMMYAQSTGEVSLSPPQPLRGDGGARAAALFRNRRGTKGEKGLMKRGVKSVPSQRLRFLHVLCGFDKIERDKMSAAQRAAGR